MLTYALFGRLIISHSVLPSSASPGPPRACHVGERDSSASKSRAKKHPPFPAGRRRRPAGKGGWRRWSARFSQTICFTHVTSTWGSHEGKLGTTVISHSVSPGTLGVTNIGARFRRMNPKTDYFAKVGGKRASEGGGATNTRADTRFPPRFVGKVYRHRTHRSDESFWGAAKRFSVQLQNLRFGLQISRKNA